MDRGAWRTTVHRVKKSQTGLKRLTMHTHELNYNEPHLIVIMGIYVPAILSDDFDLLGSRDPFMQQRNINISLCPFLSPFLPGPGT